MTPSTLPFPAPAFVWLLPGTDPKTGRLTKTPIGASGYETDPAQAGHATAVEHLAAIRAAGHNATLGLYLPAGSPHAFVDIDGGCDMHTGQLSPAAQAWLAANPSTWREWSISGTGVHIIARVPVGWDYNHATKIPGGDIYSQMRGIALGFGGCGDSNAVLCVPPGISLAASADKDWDAAVSAGVMPQWDGYEDDAELIERFKSSRGSALARFSGALTAEQLYNGDVPEDADRSRVDSQLAERLSWWTGADAERVERLMLASGLSRDKWHDRTDYLRKTIAHACARVRADNSCYVRQQSAPASAADTLPPLATPPLPTEAPGMPTARAIIASASTLRELEAACARIVGMDIECTRWEWKDLQQRVKQHAMTALNASGFTVSDARKMLPAPAASRDSGVAVGSPDWLQEWCYLASTNSFFYRSFPDPISKEAAERMMLRLYRDTLPLTATGKHQSPTELFFTTWAGQLAYTHAYLPGREHIVNMQGVPYCNTYDPDTIPGTASVYAHASGALIERIEQHLFYICDQRADIYTVFMQWVANAALRPGAKVPWAPLIQGSQGSGKSFVGYVIRKALGDRLFYANGKLAVDPAGHVRVVGPNDISNSGGFTDWAVGRAVTVLEEIYVAGGRKWDVDNGMKAFLSEPLVSINRKGAGMLTNFPNVCNYLALTNHRDAVPMDNTARRWLVMFTTMLDAMLFESAAYMEQQYFPALWSALVEIPADELRLWLSQWLITTMPFRAPATRERVAMAEESDSDLTAIVREHVTGHAVVALERVSAHLLTRGVRSVGKKELRRALAECGYQRWQGGSDNGRTRSAHDGAKITLFTQPHLNNEPSAAVLTQFLV